MGPSVHLSDYLGSLFPWSGERSLNCVWFLQGGCFPGRENSTGKAAYPFLGYKDT